ncbi:MULTISPECIES: DedA family protein [Gammaproteobacteria]|jgi:membrane protein DedA with SNARE-associated domain|uniref:DedA family protein n=2 Tax=Bacteria TaxID=2 RepID=A0A9X4YBZ8_9GAMM|nr:MULTISPECIES: DedA family protein [Gammaproteobacteria]KAA8983359.1 DedA family protein [Halospina sp. K52047b]MYL27067.1 DedA family protein [Halomonas utahensis]MYL74269.1 DedA family protein [Halomonas sp. 22501_18_FS]
MTDTVFLLVATYGSAALFAVTFLSCLAVPVPASLMMLTGGAFAASGDLPLASVSLAAYGGALSGDQTGYLLGRSCAGWLERWAEARRGRAALLGRAHASVERWGGMGVFLSRWFVSPLGPYVNFAAGAGRMRWARFSVWSVAGETVWVALYVGLGYLFASSLTAVAEFAADLSGLVAGAVVAVGLGFWLRMMQKRHGRVKG